jgi:hypothetical protein
MSVLPERLANPLEDLLLPCIRFSMTEKHASLRQIVDQLL